MQIEMEEERMMKTESDPEETECARQWIANKIAALLPLPKAGVSCSTRKWNISIAIGEKS